MGIGLGDPVHLGVKRWWPGDRVRCLFIITRCETPRMLGESRRFDPPDTTRRCADAGDRMSGPAAGNDVVRMCGGRDAWRVRDRYVIPLVVTTAGLDDLNREGAR